MKKISRRAFLKYCATTASVLALSPAMAIALPAKLIQKVRLPVIWLSFQECTGCTESLTRSHAPSIEDLIFDFISLDYHHTLQAASGEAAEAAREETIKDHYGRYLLVVDGSIPTAEGGIYSTIAGRTNLDILKECSAGAAAVLAVGTCAAFGGLPAANPNPTGAVGVASLMEAGQIAKKKLVNISGCPPLPVAISSLLAHYLAFDRFPALDEHNRPLAFYGNTVHERCSRYHFYQEEKFAESFDDEGARKGWCLYKLGCKGPTTHNACAIYKWNKGTSFPIEAGHGCIGCSEPGFWDKGRLYASLDVAELPDKPAVVTTGSSEQAGKQLYDSNCVYCHSPDPSGFKSAPDDIADILKSGDVRAHQRLDFSPDDLKALEAFFKSNAKK